VCRCATCLAFSNRMCSLTINLFSYCATCLAFSNRMCSLTINLFSYCATCLAFSNTPCVHVCIGSRRGAWVSNTPCVHVCTGSRCGVWAVRRRSALYQKGHLGKHGAAGEQKKKYKKTCLVFFFLLAICAMLREGRSFRHQYPKPRAGGEYQNPLLNPEP